MTECCIQIAGVSMKDHVLGDNFVFDVNIASAA